ncbi:MAG: hypothetical protein E7588_04625 [Ruminococcaceae bacterium]|nr:hypothetical protein [Oscillospiraceae bacterium]
MKQKVILFAACLCVFLSSGVFAGEDYMKYFWAYTSAMSGGNPSEICASVDALDAALPDPSNADEYNKLIWAVQTAASEYEKAGNYDKALYYYQKFVDYAAWLQENDGQNHAENIKLSKAVINHLTLQPEIYIATKNPADAVYYGTKNEPHYGVFNGTCDGFNPESENAHLLYVRFFDETVESFFYMLPDTPSYLLVAWNVPNENKADLDRINSGTSDEYIIENLKYINTLPHKVLIRFGAEINCWDMPADKAQRDEYIQSFKSAFIRISKLAKKYAPDAAMVYSPNDVSNMYVTAEDFYPGDEYVDWVGMSTYSVLDSNASNLPADRVDAYYFRGLYDNPIVKIRSIVNSFGDRKPILISECGFAYSSEDGQTHEHAMRKMKEFYTYVNMVYPQIKGILYFNADYERKFKLDNTPDVSEVYRESLKSNIGIQAMLSNTSEGYARFSSFEGKKQPIELYAYAMYPSDKAISVSYTLDGQPLQSQPEIPYKATMDTGLLNDGKHVLTLTVTCGDFVKTRDYIFYTEGDTLTQTAPEPLPFPDVTQNDWFYNDIKIAYRNKLINGKNGIYAPYEKMTYAEAVKLAACMHQLYHEKAVTLTNGHNNWYDSYDEYAVKNSIVPQSISGKADVFINRKAFVSIFHEALPCEEYIEINNVESNDIPDVQYNADDFECLCIYDFYRAGILTGSDGGYFHPDDSILRCEVAAILTRMFERTARKKIG